MFTRNSYSSDFSTITTLLETRAKSLGPEPEPGGPSWASPLVVPQTTNTVGTDDVDPAFFDSGVLGKNGALIESRERESQRLCDAASLKEQLSVGGFLSHPFTSLGLKGASVRRGNRLPSPRSRVVHQKDV
ncbi:hypothetical protein EYF80_030229 [Liparis tanakae]|uniref:Uncharacterized protein n=1 Tax=Liparis tanakae TaxID=230148 RepID=A0A4Z2H1D4_9TELE|nr:hypothetical protein EYF80_030229 [Liparis tanakae]